MSSRADLERLPRDELVIRARSLGVARPEVMTRVELVDEIVRLSEHDPVARRRARGWLGIARDLVASLIEQGLNMPDAAELVRTTANRAALRAPVATVTLAEIYATQGHVRRALSMLGEVLSREPEHEVARKLKERLAKDAPAEPVVAEPPPPESEDLDAPESERPLPPLPSLAIEPAVDTLESGWEPEKAPEPEPPPPPPPPPEPRREIPRITRDSALVMVKTASSAWYLHWELSGPPGRDTLLKIVAWVPRVIGPQRIEKEILVTQASGGLLLPSFGARAVVRGAIGVSSPSGFTPVAVGSVLDRANDPQVSWAPPGERALLDAAHKRALAALDARPS